MPYEQTVAESPSLESMAGRYLIFKLGEESYGISVLKIREIIQMLPITRIPRTPEYLKGVINLRGKVIPVADLRIKFAFEHADVNERTCIVMVALDMPDGREALTGLIVDAVEDVLQISAEQIAETPSFADSSISAHFIQGMANVKDDVKMLLDIDQVVAAEPMMEVKENLSSAAEGTEQF